MPRCGSLDSLRDGPHVPHDDGKLELVGGGGGDVGVEKRDASGTKYTHHNVVCIQNIQDVFIGIMVQ